MPSKVVVLHQYQRVWWDVWTDGRELSQECGRQGQTIIERGMDTPLATGMAITHS